jgi:hypothetical protein
VVGSSNATNAGSVASARDTHALLLAGRQLLMCGIGKGCRKLHHLE